MNAPSCQRLDDYLARDLTGEELARFTAHLPTCAACRQTAREHERLAALLTAATARLEPVPAGLTGRIERRLRARRRLPWMAAAAALLVAAFGLWRVSRFAPPPVAPELARVEVRPAPPLAPEPQPLVRVRFPGRADLIVVPEAMESPNVTFVWVYPGLGRKPLPAPAPALSPSPTERRGL